MPLPENVTVDELAEIKRREEMIENKLLEPHEILKEIRNEKSAEEERLRRVAKEAEEKVIAAERAATGQDPEEFLRMIFFGRDSLLGGLQYNSREADWNQWDWASSPDLEGVFWLFSYMVCQYVKDQFKERIAESYIPKMRWKHFRGIDNLLIQLRGKRIVLFQDAGGAGFLRVVEVDKLKSEIGIEITAFNGKRILLSDLIESANFLIGDKLQYRDGRSAVVVVIGFTASGEVVYQEDGKYDHDIPISMHRRFIIIRKT